MNIFYFILLVMIVLMFGNNIIHTLTHKQIDVGDYKTTHFRSDSYDFFKKVELESGYSEETLEELAMMEDQFLTYEKDFNNNYYCHFCSQFLLD